jgi:hypothetical protein
MGMAARVIGVFIGVMGVRPFLSSGACRKEQLAEPKLNKTPTARIALVADREIRPIDSGKYNNWKFI